MSLIPEEIERHYLRSRESERLTGLRANLSSFGPRPFLRGISRRDPQRFLT